VEGLSPDPAAWGVLTGFRDATGGWRTASAATIAAVLDALGADAERPADDGRVQVVRSGRRPRLARPATVVLEDGTDLGVATGRLPAGRAIVVHGRRAGERPIR